MNLNPSGSSLKKPTYDGLYSELRGSMKGRLVFALAYLIPLPLIAQQQGLQTETILEFAIDRAGAVNVYWNLLIGVTTAVLGTMASGRAFTRSRTLKIVLSLTFAVFALSNLDAILGLGELRNALLDMLPAELPPEVTDSLRPASPMAYIFFHGFLDLMVLLAIWCVPWPNTEKTT